MNLIVTLGFCRPEFLEAAIVRCKEQTKNYSDFKHVVFDCSYPIPDEFENTLKFQSICKKHSCDLVILPKNKGVVGNYGEVAYYTKRLYPDSKYLLFYDPDSNPLDVLWAEKTLQVFESKQCAYVGLSRPTPDAPQDSAVEHIGMLPVKRITRACGWPMGSYEASFLHKIDDWSHDNPYGYGENFMMKHFSRQGRESYMMMDVVDNGFEHLQAAWDVSYNQWKVACAHHHTALGFSEWLQSQS